MSLLDSMINNMHESLSGEIESTHVAWPPCNKHASSFRKENDFLQKKIINFIRLFMRRICHDSVEIILVGKTKLTHVAWPTFDISNMWEKLIQLWQNSCLFPTYLDWNVSIRISIISIYCHISHKFTIYIVTVVIYTIYIHIPFSSTFQQIPSLWF